MVDKIINIGVGTLSRLTSNTLCSHRFEDAVEVIELDGGRLNEVGRAHSSTPIMIDAFHIILTLEGTAYIEVNSDSYELHSNTALNLIGPKVLRNATFSSDYKGYHLMVSLPFYDETFKEGKHLTPETALHKTRFPFDKLLPQESQTLETCMLAIINTINRTNHFWHRRMVQATVRILFMEMGNIIIDKMPTAEAASLPNHHVLFFRFMQLVNIYSTRRMAVTFFADKLCLSPDYLAQAIKSFSKKPISYWINQALTTRAKTLLMNDNITIQQIVAEMNFSDQSSFGRFFKKNTGMTPAQYRRQLR